jgi:hypothetical protein
MTLRVCITADLDLLTRNVADATTRGSMLFEQILFLISLCIIYRCSPECYTGALCACIVRVVIPYHRKRIAIKQ